MDTDEVLIKSIDDKIQWGNDMVENLKHVEKVEGTDKLARKIQQEVKFLKKVRSEGNATKEHLLSTNLIHLNAIVDRLMLANSPVSILKPFKHENSRLEVDIVCDGGSSWIKVIARNAKALTLISRGDAEYGQKSVFDQASLYLKCARNNPHMYKSPTIIFHFACGIEKPLASQLHKIGITIEGKIFNGQDNYDDCNLNDYILHNESDIDSTSNNNIHDLVELNTNIKSTDIKILNLDVSTLLAYVTNMTNGHANFKYIEPLLTVQAEWERCRPLKPILDSLFEGKELIVCQTAYDNFSNIISLIGGANEKTRSLELIKRVKIVDDIPKGKIMELSLIGKIKARSRLIFASGENLKSITVSANEGFVRAARMQGVECMVFIHEPRSLSEMKEVNAKKIECI